MISVGFSTEKKKYSYLCPGLHVVGFMQPLSLELSHHLLADEIDWDDGASELMHVASLSADFIDHALKRFAGHVASPRTDDSQFSESDVVSMNRTDSRLSDMDLRTDVFTNIDATRDPIPPSISTEPIIHQKIGFLNTKHFETISC